MNTLKIGALVTTCASMVLGCATADLTTKGAQVATAQSAPVDYGWDPSSCKQLGTAVGQGGGEFGGWVSNNDLITYALNDLRNKAAEMGANYVQHDAPTLGQSGSKGNTTTSTATVSGTVFFCERKRTGAEAAGDSKGDSKTACVKGATQACVGAGGCKGGQACLPDGSGYSPCDCGPVAKP